MLNIENITLSYKTKKITEHVIDNFSLSIKEGEVIAILGPSGCGKSTLLKALSCNMALAAGEVCFEMDGKREILDSRIQTIGLIPQDSGLLPWKTVEENSVLPLHIKKTPLTQEKKNEIQTIYEQLGIQDILSKYPMNISGGQAKRASIARAFIMHPDLMLMDEPFSALDAIRQEEAQELFLKLWKQYQNTTILVTHSIEEALYLGHRILVMSRHGGRILYEEVNPYFSKRMFRNQDYLERKEYLREFLINGCREEE